MKSPEMIHCMFKIYGIIELIEKAFPLTYFLKTAFTTLR